MKERPNRLDQPLQDIADAIANPLLRHLEDCTEVEEKEEITPGELQVKQREQMTDKEKYQASLQDNAHGV